MFGFKKKKVVPESVEAPKAGRKIAGRKIAKGKKRHMGPYSPEQRRQAVEAFRKSGMTARDFAKLWGTSEGSLYNWIKVYEEHGPKGLESASFRADPKKRGRKGLPAAVKEEITAVKRQNPEMGTKGVRNFLFRFRAVKVSDGTVRKTLKEANLPPVPPPKKKRRIKKKPKVQRFERARPMQLWQTDITSYVLARHSQRVYLTVFMDDHSRYVVSWRLALSQTKEFVMETLLEGISRFGKPEEVLTDQGRQYFSWRGKSDFRKLLRKQGIRHVVARAHHPQTVGKCERFWETVQNEFWERVEPQELSDAQARMEQFIAHYNHFRPHQGLNGMTPADRFFEAADEVRQAIEETISKNALRLAVGESPRKPVFLIGQIGETPVSLHGEKGKLTLQMPDGAMKRLDYEEFGHARKLPTETQNEGENDERRSNETGTRDDGGEAQRTAQEAPEPEVLAPQDAAAPGQGALGDGNSGAAREGARGLGRAHGVLAGEDHQAGSRAEAQDPAPSNLAALPAGDLGYGGRAAHSAESTPPARGEEQGDSHAEGPGKRSSGSPKEDREARKAGLHAGETHRGFARDARLQGCEDSDGGAQRGHSGGSDTECSNNSSESSDQENDESNTDRSSS